MALKEHWSINIIVSALHYLLPVSNGTKGDPGINTG